MRLRPPQLYNNPQHHKTQNLRFTSIQQLFDEEIVSNVTMNAVCLTLFVNVVTTTTVDSRVGQDKALN